MHKVITVVDAIALLKRSVLPTVITEGSDDYRVMRKMEERLSDLGVDFLPVGGRDIALQIWQNLPASRKHNTFVIVDLDMWMYFGIPQEYIGEGISYTKGYSIENDIFLDGNLLSLCNKTEKSKFFLELRIISAWYARELEKAHNQQQHKIDVHPAQVLAEGDISASLTASEKIRFNHISANFGQLLRGKTIFQLLVRQLNYANRYVKYGYKHLYDIGSTQLGPLFEQFEIDIRRHFSKSP